MLLGMEKPLQLANLCAECGTSIIYFSCKCTDGPKVLKLPIPPEWEEYFWFDGSVKPVLVKLI